MVLEIPPLSDGQVMLIQRDIATFNYELHRTQRYTLRVRPDLLKNILFHLVFNGQPDPFSPNVCDVPWQVVRHIKISTPRGEVYKDFVPRHMKWLNFFEFGTYADNDFPDANPGIGEYTYKADLLCPFENHTAKYDVEETILNSNESTEIWIDVTWGDVDTDISDVGVGPIFDLELHVIPLERQPINLSDKLEPRKKLIDLSEVRPLTDNDQEIQYLLPENTLIKTILVSISRTGGAPYNGYRSGANWLANLQIVDDDNANVWFEMTGDEIQSDNKMYYGNEDVWPWTNSMGSPNAKPADGLYVVEFDRLRDLTSCYNTAGKNYPKLILNFARPVPNENETTEIGIFIRQVNTPPALQIVPPPMQEARANVRPQPLPVQTFVPTVPIAPISPDTMMDV